MQQSIVFLTVFFLGLVADATAQTSTVEVTIQSVKPKEITVGYKTNLGDKTITLDVSRKATITLNGQEATLDLLGSGHKASVEYNRELEIVTKIVATGEVVGPPELLKVSELEGSYPWLSEDGLTVYWEREFNSIWTAHRDSPDSYFSGKRELFPGRHPTVSADGLEMIFITGARGEEFTLHVATRGSLDGSFSRAQEITELRNEPSQKNPCLSSDGLTLYFNRTGKEGVEFAFTTRSSRTSPWNTPKPLPIQFSAEGGLSWLFVTSDGLTMYCSHEAAGQLRAGKGNLMIWSRPSSTQPFSKYKYIEIEGLPALTGRCPRYVAASGELFLQHMTMTGGKRQSQISVIKNFSPETMVREDVASVAEPADDLQRALIGKWEETRPRGLRNYREFRSNGIFTFTGSANNRNDGTWRIDGKTVYYKTPSDKDEVFFEVLKAEKDRLTILMRGQRTYTWQRVE